MAKFTDKLLELFVSAYLDDYSDFLGRRDQSDELQELVGIGVD